MGRLAPLPPVASPDVVSRMLQQLEESVNVEKVPNPSVLLAMNLAGDTSSNARERLLQQIKEEAVEKAQKGGEGRGVPPAQQLLPAAPALAAPLWVLHSRGCSRVPTDMTSGQVALSVLALLSSGQDPRHVHAQGRTVDLVRILQQKTDEEVAELGTLGWEGGWGLPRGGSPTPCPDLPPPHRALLRRGKWCPQDHPVPGEPGRPGPVPAAGGRLRNGVRAPGQEAAEP